MARTARIAALDNGTNPDALGRLSEPGTADMEAYLDEALILLPLLGSRPSRSTTSPRRPP